MDGTAPTSSTTADDVARSVASEPPQGAKAVATAALQAVAAELHFETRTTAAGVLQISLTSTAAFASLNTIHEAVKTTSKRVGIPIEDVVMSQGSEVILAARIGRKRGRPAEPVERGEATDAVDKVASVIAKVKKQSSNAIVDEELDVARGVLERALARLCGVNGAEEKCVQSFGVFQRRLALSDPRPRLIVGLRLNAGIAVAVTHLKTVLGPCWSDGALTTSESIDGVDSVVLPLSDEGEASRAFGNFPILLVTSVPVSNNNKK